MMLHVTSGNKASPRRELCLIFEPPAQHRVAAVLAIDTVGYTRLMGLDEALTHARYKSHRRELIDIEVAGSIVAGSSSLYRGTASLRNSPARVTRCSAPSTSRARWRIGTPANRAISELPFASD